MSKRTDEITFAAQLGSEGVPASVILQTLKWARALQTIAEKDCNYGLEPRDESRKASLEVWLSKSLIEYGIGAQFSGDPRGLVVKLRLPSGKGNDWGGEGLYCVPA